MHTEGVTLKIQGMNNRVEDIKVGISKDKRETRMSLN